MLKHHFQTSFPPDPASKRSYSAKKLFLTWWRLCGFRQKIFAGKNAIVGKNVTFRLTDNARLVIGDHSIIDDGSFFILTKPEPELILGQHVGIGIGCLIACKTKMVIGDHTRLGAGVIIRDSTHEHKKGLRLLETETIIKPVTIGKNIWIGDRVMILPGVTIGDGAVISANSVVTHDVKPNTLVAGQPARAIKEYV